MVLAVLFFFELPAKNYWTVFGNLDPVFGSIWLRTSRVVLWTESFWLRGEQGASLCSFLLGLLGVDTKLRVPWEHNPLVEQLRFSHTPICLKYTTKCTKCLSSSISPFLPLLFPYFCLLWRRFYGGGRSNAAFSQQYLCVVCVCSVIRCNRGVIAHVLSVGHPLPFFLVLIWIIVIKLKLKIAWNNQGWKKSPPVLSL